MAAQSIGTDLRVEQHHPANPKQSGCIVRCAMHSRLATAGQGLLQQHADARLHALHISASASNRRRFNADSKSDANGHCDGDSNTKSDAYTRVAPKDWPRPPSRIDAALIANTTWPSKIVPTCYVCGPTSFVESASRLLTSSGNDPEKIRTERFGPTGERQ